MFCDRTEEPDRRREIDTKNLDVAEALKKDNMPKVAISIIDQNYFSDTNYLSDFESFSSGLYGRMLRLAVLGPGFEITVDRHGFQKYAKWWPTYPKRNECCLCVKVGFICVCCQCAEAAACQGRSKPIEEKNWLVSKLEDIIGGKSGGARRQRRKQSGYFRAMRGKWGVDC